MFFAIFFSFLSLSSFSQDLGLVRVNTFLKEFDHYVQSKTEFFKKEPENIKNKDWVSRKLAFMKEIDQYSRSKYDVPFEQNYNELEKEYFDKEFGKRSELIDYNNTEDLKLILKEYTWLKISEFGIDADSDAWLIVQHADNDPEFQKSVLKVLEKLWSVEETNKQHYAYLFDRVAASWVNPLKRKLQRYGTQGMCRSPGNWEPLPIKDLRSVDVRRGHFGLESLRSYINTMNEYCY